MSLSGHNQNELEPAGRKALLFFFNVAKEYPKNFQISYDQMLHWMEVSDHQGYRFIENFGDSVLIVADRYGWEQVQKYMEDLANDAEGRLPAFPDGTFHSYDMMQAMVSAVSTVSWRTVKIDTIAIAEGTAKDLKTVAIWGLSGVALYYTLGGALGLFILLYQIKGKK